MKILRLHRLVDLFLSKKVWLDKLKAESDPNKIDEYLDNINYINERMAGIRKEKYQ